VKKEIESKPDPEAQLETFLRFVTVAKVCPKRHVTPLRNNLDMLENVRIQQLPWLDGDYWWLTINGCMEKEGKHISTYQKFEWFFVVN